MILWSSPLLPSVASNHAPAKPRRDESEFWIWYLVTRPITKQIGLLVEWRLYEGRKIFITFRKPVNMQIGMLIAFRRLARIADEGYRSINVPAFTRYSFFSLLEKAPGSLDLGREKSEAVYYRRQYCMEYIKNIYGKKNSANLTGLVIPYVFL